MSDKYDDIINMPHHVSDRYPQMPMSDRAAQFAPFSALTGYGDIVDEVARLTNKRIELDEYEIELINKELQYVLDHIDRCPTVKLLYFIPDKKKSGGVYREMIGSVIEVDDYNRKIVFVNGASIEFENIIALNVLSDGEVKDNDKE